MRSDSPYQPPIIGDLASTGQLSALNVSSGGVSYRDPYSSKHNSNNSLGFFGSENIVRALVFWHSGFRKCSGEKVSFLRAIS